MITSQAKELRGILKGLDLSDYGRVRVRTGKKAGGCFGKAWAFISEPTSDQINALKDAGCEVIIFEGCEITGPAFAKVSY